MAALIALVIIGRLWQSSSQAGFDGASRALPVDFGSEVSSHDFNPQSFLARFFGSNEAAIQHLESLRQRGVEEGDLREPMPEERFLELAPKWSRLSRSEQEDLIDAFIDWPSDGADAEWVRRLLGIDLSVDEATLERVNAIGEEYYPVLYRNAESYVSELSAAFEFAVLNGDFRYAPYLLENDAANSSPAEGNAHLCVRSGGGWAMSVTVTREVGSDLEMYGEQNAVIRHQRDFAIRSLFGGGD